MVKTIGGEVAGIESIDEMSIFISLFSFSLLDVHHYGVIL